MFRFEGYLISTFNLRCRGRLIPRSLFSYFFYLFQQIGYRVGANGPAPRLSGIFGLAHLTIKPFPDFLVHPAITSGRKWNTIAHKMIDMDCYSAEPIGHRWLSTAPLRCLCFCLKVIFAEFVFLPIGNRDDGWCGFCFPRRGRLASRGVAVFGSAKLNCVFYVARQDYVGVTLTRWGVEITDHTLSKLHSMVVVKRSYSVRWM